ncbi:Ribosome-binding protein 1 [Babesia ovata]|uniref:Ribosome-binding protein 1 n=1 Tax=Babesia ovata TaxID=189622 RepID=A0A2H6KAT7_9APIC|nr:Ribosome-binding protein 1 [Babesia ovata]GBE60096.1 Ribosome-binding protein 1 [Babesia ovata]
MPPYRGAPAIHASRAPGLLGSWPRRPPLRLCTKPQQSTNNPNTAKKALNALLECIPKLLSALYFLRYQVDDGFKALGGGRWKGDRPGEGPRDGGGQLTTYLLEKSGSTKYGGVIPGGFGRGEFKNRYQGGYPQGSFMATDLQNIMEKYAHRDDIQNYFLDVYSTTAIPPTSGADTPNVANALRLVEDFCRIFGNVKNEEDFKSHLYRKNRCIQWEDLKAHCNKLKDSLGNIFSHNAFSFTGYAREYGKLNKQDIAKKMASWLKKNLGKVKQKMKKIDAFSGVSNLRQLRKGIKSPSSSQSTALQNYFTKQFIPYGFTFYANKYDTRSAPYDLLQRQWDTAIRELKKPEGGLAKLVDILNGEQCRAEEQKRKENQQRQDKNQENVDDQDEEEDEEPEDEELLDSGETVKLHKPGAAKPVATKAEATNPTATKDTEGAQNQGKKSEGAQNQGKKSEGAQNQGEKSEGAQNQGKKVEGAQNQGKDQGGGTLQVSPVTGSAPDPPSVDQGVTGPAGPTGVQHPQGPSGTVDLGYSSTPASQPQNIAVSQQTSPQDPPEPPPPVPPPPAAPPSAPAGPDIPAKPGPPGQGSSADSPSGQKFGSSEAPVPSRPPGFSGSRSGPQGGQQVIKDAALQTSQNAVHDSSSAATTSVTTASGGGPPQYTVQKVARPDPCPGGKMMSLGIPDGKFCVRETKPRFLVGNQKSPADLWKIAQEKQKQRQEQREREAEELKQKEALREKHRQQEQLQNLILSVEGSNVGPPLEGKALPDVSALVAQKRKEAEERWKKMHRKALLQDVQCNALIGNEIHEKNLTHHSNIKAFVTGSEMPDPFLDAQRQKQIDEVFEENQNLVTSKLRDQYNQGLRDAQDRFHESIDEAKKAEEAERQKQLEARRQNIIERLKEQNGERIKAAQAMQDKIKKLAEQKEKDAELRKQEEEKRMAQLKEAEERKKQEEENERKKQKAVAAKHPLMPAPNYYRNQRPHYYDTPEYTSSVMASFADQGGPMLVGYDIPQAPLDGGALPDESRIRSWQEDRSKLKEGYRKILESQQRADDDMKMRIVQSERKQKADAEKWKQDQANVSSLFTVVDVPDAKGVRKVSVPEVLTSIGVPLGHPIKPPKAPSAYMGIRIPPAEKAPPKRITKRPTAIGVAMNKHSPISQATLTSVTPQIADSTIPADLRISSAFRSQAEGNTIFAPNLNSSPIPIEYVEPPPQIRLDVAPAGRPSPRTSDPFTDQLDLHIDVAKPILQDPAHDFDFDDDSTYIQDDTLSDAVAPYKPAISLNVLPPEAEELPPPPTDFDPDLIKPRTVGMCPVPWLTQKPTHDASAGIPETELFPSEAPRTVRDMLVWMAGLQNPKHQETLEKCIHNAFKRDDDVSAILQLPVNGAHIRPKHVIDTIHLAAVFAASVLTSIEPNWRVAVSSVTSTPKESDQSKDPDCCALLCHLRDYAYASHHQLAFLKSQCSREQSQGGWQDCQYGHAVSLNSPLQAFLTDASDFETHFFDPCNLWLKSRVRMGFGENDLPRSHETGKCISTIFTSSCGGNDPLPTLCSYLNCLTRRTPRTTGELVSFFHNFGNSLHKHPSELSRLGSALSNRHDDCPKWDRLETNDLQTIRKFRGFDASKHDNEHPSTLSTLLGCGKKRDYCVGHFTPITYQAYGLYSPSFAYTYLIWTVYLADELHDSLETLYMDFENRVTKCESLNHCDKALPLLYYRGFTPPEGIGQSSLKCSDIISKLQVVLSGKLIADLVTCMDNFFYGIRKPFIYTQVTLWSAAFLLLAHTMLYRLDVLHIRSHLLTTTASHLIDVKALLTHGRKLLSLYDDVDYFDDDPGQLDIT